MTKKLEKTYREMLKEGKKVKKEQDELDMEKDKEEIAEAEEAEQDLKKGDEPEKPSAAANRPADDSKKGLKEAKKMKKEEKDDCDDEDDDDMDEEKDMEDKEKAMKEKLKESHDASMAEMGSLLESQEALAEDHKDQVKTLFEAALTDRTKIIEESLRAKYENDLNEAVKEVEDSLVESLDRYLDKVVANWLEENRLAVESGVKGEIVESFLAGMKTLFVDHYVAVPDEKLDLVENIITESEEMEAQLNEEMKRRMQLEAELQSFKKKEVIETLAEGMTMTDKERLIELTEEIDFKDADGFAKKVKVIKEGFVKKSPSNSEIEILNEGEGQNSKPASTATNMYTEVLSRMSVDKFGMSRRDT